MTAPAHDRRTILVRPPSPLLADGEVTHIERAAAVDIKLALQQWQDYIEVFRRHGWDVVELPALPDHPDGVFVEDVVVMFGDLAVITRPGTASRLGEIDGIDTPLTDLGYRVERVEQPGTLDGGDVLKVGTTIYIGLGGRTNVEGIEQFRSFVEPMGATVIAVPMTKALHLKSAVTALPDGTVIGFDPIVDDSAVFGAYLGVPEEPGAHVVEIDDDTVVMTARTPLTRALFEARGLTVVVTDISEFEKLEGCVTCLSVRLRTNP
jgi:dimethylargininase